MALGDGNAWDPSVPGNSDVLKDGAAEIRDLRQGVETRLEREHATFAASGVGGEHKEGSARAYHTVALTEPTNQPDGSTALTGSADSGRLAVLGGGILFYYVEATAEWLPVLGTILKTGTISSTADLNFSSFETVSYPFSMIVFSIDSLTYDANNTAFTILTTRNTDELFFVTIVVAGQVLEIDCDQTSSNFRFRIGWNPTQGGARTWRYRVIA